MKLFHKFSGIWYWESTIKVVWEDFILVHISNITLTLHEAKIKPY
jgi:hypothetical protein